MTDSIKYVFLVGAKGIGTYGGYETFVNKLTEYHQNNDKIKYCIACKANGSGAVDEASLGNINKISDSEFIYHNAHCFKMQVANLGSAQAILYDIKALNLFCKYVKENNIKDFVVYIMACRIGFAIKYFAKKIHKLGGKVYLNPDGHEWKRAKWPLPVRKYWKISESLMVKHSDLIVCDSVNIEKYIHESYDNKGLNKKSPKTTYIAYGAETGKSSVSDNDKILTDWYSKKGLSKKNYYLVVGRFVPENNYETMIREFMKSDSKKDFAIITNVNDKFLKDLENRLHFNKDKRIKFVGTVYNQELLMKIRENAYGYFHGHEVGGTNPSLLEALGSTDLNLLLDVGFNREVAQNSALYWNKNDGNLAKLINKADNMSENEIKEFGEKAKKRIKDAYSWEYIADRYEKVFLSDI